MDARTHARARAGLDAVVAMATPARMHARTSLWPSLGDARTHTCALLTWPMDF